MRLRLYTGTASPPRFTALAPALGCALLALTACADGGEQAAPEADPDAVAAELDEAQLLQFRDVTLYPEGSESGTYSELATVGYAEEARDQTELDKPECADAANPWSRLEEVRDAPSSLASYTWGPGSVSHMLLRLPEGAGPLALDTVAPSACASYSATHGDGGTTSYELRDLEADEIGDGSRAFSVDVLPDDGEPSRLYNLLYLNGDHLGSTSVLGAGPEDDYVEMLVAFSEAAYDRQRQILG